MTTKLITILIVKVDKPNPTKDQLDSTVDQLLKLASILEQETNLMLEEGEYTENSTSLMLR